MKTPLLSEFLLHALILQLPELLESSSIQEFFKKVDIHGKFKLNHKRKYIRKALRCISQFRKFINTSIIIIRLDDEEVGQ